MFSLISFSNNACRRAAQLFITSVIILVLGKLITLVPVMHQLPLANTFKAADVIWFLSKLAALGVFYLFARYSIEAIPNKGGVLSFVRGIAEPLTALLIVIMGQALLWQLLEPFVHAIGRTVYYSAAIILIVCVSVWFVLRAYQHAFYIVDSVRKVGGLLARFVPQQKIVCAQCHAEISTDVNFCSQCGYKVQESLCCSACGEMVSEEQAYCHNCGSMLSKVARPNR